MTSTETPATTQVFGVYSKATPERVWQAITDPEWNARYGYAAPQFDELRPGGRFHSTWRMLMDPTAAEPMTTITYELKPSQGGTRLTFTHRLSGAPATAHMVSGALDDADGQGGGGWSWVLSDLKSLLETGSTLAG